MANTLLGIFDDAAAARHAIDQLHAGGLDLEDISIISPTGEQARAVGDAEHLSAGEGAAVGAVWGGLIGLAALLIPGVGPFIAGGVIFATLTGAAAGAVVGGIAGALIERAGIPEEDARDYEMLVYSGRTLLAVKAHEQDANAVRQIMAQAGARSIRDNQTDITGADTPIHVSDVDRASGDARPDLAPGGATVRDASGLPQAASPLLDRPSTVGVSGAYSATASPRGIYETPAFSDPDAVAPRRETENIAAGTEDPYGTPQVDNQSGAILTEGWDRIGYAGDRHETGAEPHDSDTENPDKRS